MPDSMVELTQRVVNKQQNIRTYVLSGQKLLFIRYWVVKLVEKCLSTKETMFETV
jgi:hypothetical protein